MNQHPSQAAVETLAKKLGFFSVGFAVAEPMPEDAAKFREWLSRGYAADMEYLTDIEKRTNPLAVFPRAKTIIMVALNYYQKNGPKDFAVGRYAWGRDYHSIVKKKLDVLAKFLHGQNRGEYKMFCDTAHVAEKLWAVKAGIGWQGKNSLVLTREAGSFFVLGGILTTHEYLPSAPQQDGCGSCTRCIDACPQQAIEEARVVNPKKCTSYWTVETRQPKIPSAVAKKMGRWVFGCDICQLVCPYNQHAQVTKEHFGNNFARTRIREFENISDKIFHETFFETPLWRRGNKNLQKNIAAVRNAEKKKLVRSV